jgi:phospholipid/cholesterol/gamma-HCH transport system substrate-binding protein
METRANYVLIGLFTLAVIAGGFGFVYWFHRGGGVGERTSYQVVFDGPVSGVRVGAGVAFNGIRVGEVTNLALDPTNPRQVIAVIAVSKNAPVRADTRVSVEYQGLTGIAALALRGGSQGAPMLQPSDGQMPRLQVELGTTQDVLQSGREVLRRLDEILLENQEALRNTVKNLETFSAMMARNSDRVDRIVLGAEDIVTSTQSLVGKEGEIQQAVRSFKQVGENLDKRIEETVQSVKQLATNLDGQAGTAVQSFKKLTESVDGNAAETLDSVKKLIDNLDKRTAEISVGVLRFTNSGLQQWERFAVDGRRAANELERAVKNFDRNPSRVIWGGGSSSSGTSSSGSASDSSAQQPPQTSPRRQR